MWREQDQVPIRFQNFQFRTLAVLCPGCQTRFLGCATSGLWRGNTNVQWQISALHLHLGSESLHLQLEISPVAVPGNHRSSCRRRNVILKTKAVLIWPGLIAAYAAINV